MKSPASLAVWSALIYALANETAKYVLLFISRWVYELESKLIQELAHLVMTFAIFAGIIWVMQKLIGSKAHFPFFSDVATKPGYILIFFGTLLGVGILKGVLF